MIDGLNAAEKEIDGQVYHVLRMNNAQAAEMLDKWAAVLQPVFAKMPPVTKDSEVIVAGFDRVASALVNLGFAKLAKLADEVFAYCFCGDVPMKGKFADPEWSGRWDTIVKLVGAFIQVQYGGFSKLLPSGAGDLAQLIVSKVKAELAKQATAGSSPAPTSTGSTGALSESAGPH